jgi:hypothetical protein
MIRSFHRRTILRWSTVGVAGFAGAYAYSQFHAGHPLWTDAARYGVFPVIRLSGAWGWQQSRLAAWFRGLRPCAAKPENIIIN